MRKIILSVIALVLLPATILFATNAEIKSFTGKVEIQEPGSTAWVAVAEGQILKSGTIISTGFNANATIDMDETSEIFVRSLTRVAIEDLTITTDAVKTSLNLTMGKIKADVKTTTGLKHNFTLKTPVSTAAVRGTVFEAGVASIYVETGSVGFSNSIGQTVNVVRDASATNSSYISPVSAVTSVLASTTVATYTSTSPEATSINTVSEKATRAVTISWK